MRFLLAAALAAAVAAGSGSGTAVRTIVLDVHHSRFSPDELRVRPGETVRFVVRNTDPIPHELIVGDQSVQDAHEHGTEAHHGERPGEVSVAPGATAVTTYRFGAEPGRLLFGCHLPGHWAYGMRGTIRVG
ncbi:MAG: plastocyanin/azurin family copper-binding protein [Actinomycetota bacterium]|nr:plastocyanin/azurin family copper-binding protein [Actinomycetota bacterium]